MPPYTPLLRWIHWITAALFITAMLIGLYCGLQPAGTSPRRELLEVHKSLGETLLLLTVLRLVVRAMTAAPPHTGISRLVQLAAGLNHLGLYALLIVMPVTGYLFSSAGGYRLKYFGMFDLPRLFGGNQAVAAFGERSHEFLAWLVYAAVAMHIAATLWHELVEKDGTLARMWPRRSRSVVDGS